MYVCIRFDDKHVSHSESFYLHSVEPVLLSRLLLVQFLGPLERLFEERIDAQVLEALLLGGGLQRANG